jgi:hypothetical protein
MNLKQFLKPDWRRVILALIFTILPFNITNIPLSKKILDVFLTFYQLAIFEYLLWGLFFKLSDFFLFYIFSSFIVSSYDKIKISTKPITSHDRYAIISLFLATGNLIITKFTIPFFSDYFYDLKITSSNADFWLQWMFFISLPLFFVSMFFGVWGLKSPKRQINKITRGGIIISIIGVLMVLFYLVGFFFFYRP